jgi:phage shock protein PspC (stress-responsive transcriptional regulator)/predicted membrane protein
MSEQTVEGPTIKRLERSRSDRMLAGVCGGLASYFEIHPAFYRVGFVVLTLLGGAGVLIYIAAVLVMPKEGEADSVATAALRDRRDRPWPLIGLGLLAVGGAVLLSHATLWPQGDAWVVLLIAGGAILWITRHGKGETATTDPTKLAAADSHRIRRVFAWIAITIASLVALVFVAAAIFAAVVHVHVGRGVGDRSYTVAGLQDLRQNYRLGIGSLRVDLSDVQFPAGETHVGARVDVGKLDVIVPSGVALQVHGDAQFGQLDILGSRIDGHNVDQSLDQHGKRVLVLDAHVGAGDLHVTRAVR